MSDKKNATNSFPLLYASVVSQCDLLLAEKETRGQRQNTREKPHYMGKTIYPSLSQSSRFVLTASATDSVC